MLPFSQKKSRSGTCRHRISLWGLIASIVIIFSGCATIQPVDLPDENALEPAETEFWTALATERSGNWFKLLNYGNEAIEWRLRVIDSATRSLDLQTFLWLEDTTGLTVLRHILDAADRGVKADPRRYDHLKPHRMAPFGPARLPCRSCRNRPRSGP